MLLVIIIVLIGYIVWNSRSEAQKRPIVERAEQVSDSLRSISERVPTPFTKNDKKRRDQLTAWLKTHYVEGESTDADVKAFGEWFKGLNERDVTAFLQRMTAVLESLGIKTETLLKDANSAPSDVIRMSILTAWKSSSAKANA